MQELDYSLLVFHPYRDLLEFVEDAFGDDAKSAQRSVSLAERVSVFGNLSRPNSFLPLQTPPKH